MNYNDFKKKQLLLDMQKNLSTISSFIKISLDDIKLVDDKIESVYSIDDQISPINKLQMELEELDNIIDNKVLINLSNELKTLK